MGAAVRDLQLPQGRPLVWEDLQAIPDDQYWGHELVEGELLVSPSPDLRHQVLVGSLYLRLRAACPTSHQVVVAPFDYTPRPGYSLQPDVLVVRRDLVGRQRMEATPDLVVEVISPSSRAVDRSLKRLVYEEAGVPSYWIVDPAGPNLTALELRDGAYVEAATARGDEVAELVHPFPVAVRPVDLLDE